MTEFIVSVVSSIVGALILIFATGLVSRRARWILTGLTSRLLGVDIDYVYENKKDLQDDLVAELKRTHNVSILTGRGNEFQRDTFAPLFMPSPKNSHERVRILLPATQLQQGEYDFIQQREEEMVRIDSAYGKRLLHSQIEANVKFLQQHLKADHVELRQFNFPHQGRIIVTERYVYFTPYRGDSHGRDNPIYKFGRGGEMYDNWLRLFEQYWYAAAVQCDDLISKDFDTVKMNKEAE